MALEIERKFIVKDVSILEGLEGRHIIQGYLSVLPVVTRVRIRGDEAFLTIKARPNGISCDEFEYAIPLDDAHEMLVHCGDWVLEKTRYAIPFGERLFEVDVFHGRHAGLVIAEVELPSVDALVALPAWVGDEVSGDVRYSNAYLVNPGELD